MQRYTGHGIQRGHFERLGHQRIVDHGPNVGRPIHWGALIKSHSVKAMAKDAIIGPSVQKIKPRIQGEAKSHPSTLRRSAGVDQRKG